MSVLHYVLHFLAENVVGLVIFAALMWCNLHAEKIARRVVRWRYRRLSRPGKDGWRARANFERRDRETGQAPRQD